MRAQQLRPNKYQITTDETNPCRPPPMIKTTFSSGVGTSGEIGASSPAGSKLTPRVTPKGRTKRSSSLSPKQALKGAFKRGSTLGGHLKKRIARRFSAAPQKVENLLDPLSRMNPTFFVQFQAYLKISFLVQSASAVMIDLFLISLSGLALGIVYSNVEESGNEIYSFAMSTLSMGIMSR